MEDQKRFEPEGRSRYDEVAAENFKLREAILDISTAFICSGDVSEVVKGIRREIDKALELVKS
jgi:hypothetical protein